MTRKLLTVLYCLCPYLGAFAQQNMTLYQMHDITQSNFLNPSVAGDCKWNVGLPALGNVSVAAEIPLAYNDLGAGKEYMDGNKILSTVRKTNLVSANISVNILTLGYRTGDMYLQFTMNEKISSKLSVSKNFFELFLSGNAPYAGKTLETNFALSVSHYREYGFNMAYDVGNDLWLGARAKLLFGRIGADSKNNVLSLYTDPATYALELNSDLLVNASVPGTVKTDPLDGTVNGFDADFEVSRFLVNPVNIGGAIDLGLNKVFENGLKVSASILNIGMINWSSNTHQFYQKSTLKYSGATSGINNWDDLADTLRSVINFKSAGGEAFSQWLTPEVMAGISYPVMDYIRAGITGYAGISSAGIPWALTATALTDNTSHVFGSLSYTVANNSFVNIGAGIGVRFGAFNLHAITDNILAIFNPAAQRYATVQFGINFKFGCGDGEVKSKRYKSIPCPSFGRQSKGLTSSVPCSSGK
ncbi:MAG: DUF5723 family protein [Prevotellaceae bacterium]|jgi:hypothetical protein|nr:DUF5723 family protein [Prevotellaceae bacterium]